MQTFDIEVTDVATCKLYRPPDQAIRIDPVVVLEAMISRLTSLSDVHCLMGLLDDLDPLLTDSFEFTEIASRVLLIRSIKEPERPCSRRTGGLTKRWEHLANVCAQDIAAITARGDYQAGFRHRQADIISASPARDRPVSPDREHGGRCISVWHLDQDQRHRCLVYRFSGKI